MRLVKFTMLDAVCVAGDLREFLEIRKVMQGQDVLLQRQMVKAMCGRDMTRFGVAVFHCWFRYCKIRDGVVTLRSRVNGRYAALMPAEVPAGPVLGPKRQPELPARDVKVTPPAVTEAGVLQHFPQLADVGGPTILATTHATDSKVWLDGSIERLPNGLGYQLILISYSTAGTVNRVTSEKFPLLANIWAKLEIAPTLRERLQKQALDEGWILALPAAAPQKILVPA